MADDWLSQATPVSQAPQQGGDDWLSAAQPVDQSSAGPPRASFQNVTGGVRVAQSSPLAQFGGPEALALSPIDQDQGVQAIQDFGSNVQSGQQGFSSDYLYPPDQLDVPKPAGMRGHDMALDVDKRRIGAGEGFIRGLGADLAEMSDFVSRADPSSAAMHVAAKLTGQPTPLQASAEEMALNPDTEQYTGARAETLGELGHEAVSNLFPVEALFGGTAKLIKTLREADTHVLADALTGMHGPEAQGTAVADQLTKNAGELHITPEMRVPAAEVPDVPVPDAALDAPAQAAGEAALPAGEPLPLQAAPAERPPSGPDLGVAAPEPGPVEESTRASQPVAQSEPDVLSHEDIDAMVSQGQLSPETAAQLKGMVSREETAQVPGQHRTIAGEVPEPAWARATVARDADGTPATVYRGSRSGTTTPENFNELGAATGHPSAHLGVWFSESAADAGKYGTLSEHHLDLRNPKVYDAADFPGFDSPEEAIALRKQLQAEGHDGVIVDARPYGGPRQFIALEPHQVIHPIEEEASHAGSLRESAGQADLGREVPQGGEVGGRGDLQFPREQEPHPLPQRLRQGREGPTEPVQAPLGPTGIKKAALAEERPGFNWEATTAHLRRSDPQAYERARTAFEKNPNHGVDLANSIAEKPRPISKEEVLALNMDRARIRNERNTAYAEAEKAINEGDTATAAAWRARVDRLDEEFARNDVAAAHSGHETAEGLRSRQLMTNDDYTMAGAVRRMTVKKGEKLTTEEQGNIERLAKEHEAAERIAAADKPARVKVAQSKFDSLAEQLKKAPRRVLCEVA